jgi:hypothetical protein
MGVRVGSVWLRAVGMGVRVGSVWLRAVGMGVRVGSVWLRAVGTGVRVGSVWLRAGCRPADGCYEHGNEPRVPYKEGKFLIGYAVVSVSKWILLHGHVSCLTGTG